MISNEIENISNKLKDFVKNKPEILEVYLFGSIIKGLQNKLSDIDIAIYINKNHINKINNLYGYKSVLLSKLIHHFSTNAIDLVILNDVGPLLYHRVITGGIRIYFKNSLDTQRREYLAIQKYLDFKPMLRIINEELYKRIDNEEFGIK